MQVLLVEDELSIAEPLIDSLQREGHVVVHAPDGATALLPHDPEPDVVLLDLRLPDIDGFTICRRLRERSTVPIIITSARGEEIDKVVGLELGADDYLVKPFGVRELLARMHAVTRRHITPDANGVASRAGASPDAIEVGSLRVDQRAHRVFVHDAEIELTPTEFALLAELARAPGAALARKDLLQRVWNTSWTSSGKTVDVQVAALRRKLGDPRWIETVRGVGYRLVERT